jgi:hypothetical protein
MYILSHILLFKYYVEHGHEIPEKLNCEKLIKVLNKELNKAEVCLKKSSRNFLMMLFFCFERFYLTII